MSSSIKILMSTDIANNKWDYTNIVCESILNLHKAEIVFVTTGRSYQPKESPFANIIESNISTKWENNFQKFKYNNDKLGRFIDEVAYDFQPDIMHLNHYCNNIKTNVPKVLTTHGDALNNIKWTSFNMHYHPYKNYIQSCLDSSEGVVSTTKSLAKNLVSSYQLKTKVNVIYNGINYETTDKMGDDCCLITSAKSLLKKHNLNMILRVLERLPEEMKIYVIGSKPKWLRLPSRLVFLENLSNDELVEFYQKSSIYLALSSWDIFNMTSFYAAYSNCAILACDSPIFREIWGDSAAFFDPNCYEDFVRNMNSLLENKLMLEKVAQNCRNKALSAYNIKRTGFEYLNLYKSVLKTDYRTAIKKPVTEVPNSTNVIDEDLFIQ